MTPKLTQLRSRNEDQDLATVRSSEISLFEMAHSIGGNPSVEAVTKIQRVGLKGDRIARTLSLGEGLGVAKVS